MRNSNRVRRETWVWYSAAALVLAVMMMLFCNGLSIISNAAEGKIIKSSVNIRKEASTSSDAVGSATNGEILTINTEVTGSDGKVWYQVTKSGVTGYIRSDLMQKVESSGGDTTLTVNPSVTVTAVNPLEATVTGGSKVRVRTDASTDSSSGIITTLDNGTKVTVKGQANGTDSNVWYLVIFNTNSGTVEGFIRSDFLNLSGEVVPADTTTLPDGDVTGTDTPTVPEETQEQKLYDTKLGDDDIWYLQDFTKAQEWNIVELLKDIEDYKTNASELLSTKGTVKTQKIVIIILVVLLIAAILLATMLYFKIKDVKDDAYFAAVEKETLRERNAMKAKDPRAPAASGRKVMQTVGTDSARAARQSEGRPVGTKPAAQNPAGRSAASAKPANGQGRPVQGAGQPRSQTGAQGASAQGRVVQPTAQTRQAAGTQGRPVVGQAGASQGSQARPAGAVQTKTAQAPGQAKAAPTSGQARPAGQATAQRPAGQTATQPGPAGQTSGQARPAGQAGTQARPAGQAATQRPAGQSAAQSKQSTSAKADQNWKNKISDDDDEFEFEFLNWDEEEK